MASEPQRAGRGWAARSRCAAGLLISAAPGWISAVPSRIFESTVQAGPGKIVGARRLDYAQLPLAGHAAAGRQQLDRRRGIGCSVAEGIPKRLRGVLVSCGPDRGPVLLATVLPIAGGLPDRKAGLGSGCLRLSALPAEDRAARAEGIRLAVARRVSGCAEPQRPGGPLRRIQVRPVRRNRTSVTGNGKLLRCGLVAPHGRRASQEDGRDRTPEQRGADRRVETTAHDAADALSLLRIPTWTRHCSWALPA